MPNAALILERDGANNLASSRFEIWNLDACAKTLYLVLENKKFGWMLEVASFVWELVSAWRASLTENRRETGHSFFMVPVVCDFSFGSMHIISPKSFFGRGLNLPNWGISEKLWCTSIEARVCLPSYYCGIVQSTKYMKIRVRTQSLTCVWNTKITHACNFSVCVFTRNYIL